MKVHKQRKRQQKRKCVNIPFFIDDKNVINASVPITKFVRWKALIAKSKNMATMWELEHPVEERPGCSLNVTD